MSEHETMLRRNQNQKELQNFWDPDGGRSYMDTPWMAALQFLRETDNASRHAPMRSLWCLGRLSPQPCRRTT